MLRRITAWVAARLGRDGERDDGAPPDRESGGSRFVPSPLDISVRIAHGGSTADVERELADVVRQARELEAGRRED